MQKTVFSFLVLARKWRHLAAIFRRHFTRLGGAQNPSKRFGNTPSGLGTTAQKPIFYFLTITNEISNY